MNTKKYFLFFIVIITASCQKKEDNFLEDMASLDKSYMHMLLIIKDVNNKNREEAIERFIITWNEFKKNIIMPIKRILNGKPISILCRIY